MPISNVQKSVDPVSVCYRRAIITTVALIGLILGGRSSLMAMDQWSAPLQENEPAGQSAGLPDEPDMPELPLGLNDLSVGVVAEIVAYGVDTPDVAEAKRRSLSDLYLNSIEIDLEIGFQDWLTTALAVEAENIGKKDDRGEFHLNEALVTIRHPDQPFYATAGKRTQPFGVFEDHMISGTLAEEVYEVNETGLTLGMASETVVEDLSLTVYQGQDIVENLREFGAHERRPGHHNPHHRFSLIANLGVSPLEHVSGALFFSSEPGDDRRNESVGSAVSVTFWKFIMDIEYITAIRRETGNDGEENLERAWCLAAAVTPVEMIELATRVEFFDDDRSGEQDEMLKYRYLTGLNYTLGEHALLSTEYRFSRYEREAGSDAADHQNEITLQLSIAY
jgi:hypothetical protein